MARPAESAGPAVTYVATGDIDYLGGVLRARDVEALQLTEKLRLLTHLVIRYPEVVAVIMEDLQLPKGSELR
jgi:hypothetical protein